jgi:hypothetical protein
MTAILQGMPIVIAARLLKNLHRVAFLPPLPRGTAKRLCSLFGLRPPRRSSGINAQTEDSGNEPMFAMSGRILVQRSRRGRDCAVLVHGLAVVIARQ